MSFNPFIGLSQTRLESELAQAQSDLLAGKATIDARSGEVMIRSQPDISLQQRIRLILRALNLIDPQTYPADQISPDSQTRIVFNSSSS